MTLKLLPLWRGVVDQNHKHSSDHLYMQTAALDLEISLVNPTRSAPKYYQLGEQHECLNNTETTLFWYLSEFNAFKAVHIITIVIFIMNISS